MKKSKTDKMIRILVIALIALLVVLVSLILNIKNLVNLSSNVDSSSQAGVDTSSENKTESEIAEENDAVIESQDIGINSIVLKKLTINSWDRVKAQFSTGYTIDEDGNYVHDEGFTLYCDSTNVQNIIFNTTYVDEVIGNVKVGDSLKEIKEKLGTPTFENKTIDMIGYKTKEVYVFFYEDEISIYPNRQLNNTSFENDLFSFISGEFDGDRTDFVIQTKRNYTDFTAVQDDDEDYIVLRSVNRQIEIKIDNENNTKIITYNGYNYESKMNENLENDNITVEEQDLAEKVEVERKLAE